MQQCGLLGALSAEISISEHCRGPWQPRLQANRTQQGLGQSSVAKNAEVLLHSFSTAGLLIAEGIPLGAEVSGDTVKMLPMLFYADILRLLFYFVLFHWVPVASLCSRTLPELFPLVSSCYIVVFIGWQVLGPLNLPPC